MSTADSEYKEAARLFSWANEAKRAGDSREYRYRLKLYRAKLKDAAKLATFERHAKWHSNSAKRPKKGKVSKRIGAALSGWLKKQNPAFKKAKGVRVQRLKGGVIKLIPEK